MSSLQLMSASGIVAPDAVVADAVNVIAVPAATLELSGGLVIDTLGAPVPGTTLTVTDAFDVPPAPLVALRVTVCVPGVAILYCSSEAPVPIGVPSSDHVADGPMSPCSGSIASPRKLIVWSLPNVVPLAGWSISTWGGSTTTWIVIGPAVRSPLCESPAVTEM